MYVFCVRRISGSLSKCFSPSCQLSQDGCLVLSSNKRENNVLTHGLKVAVECILYAGMILRMKGEAKKKYNR